jgi:hypothetical protein
VAKPRNLATAARLICGAHVATNSPIHNLLIRIDMYMCLYITYISLHIYRVSSALSPTLSPSLSHTIYCCCYTDTHTHTLTFSHRLSLSHFPPPPPHAPSLSYQQVLYDRAPARFHPRSAEEKRLLIRHLSEDEGVLRYIYTRIYSRIAVCIQSLLLLLPLPTTTTTTTTTNTTATCQRMKAQCGTPTFTTHLSTSLTSLLTLPTLLTLLLR